MFANFDWIHAITGSPIMLVLFACSVITLAVVIERFVFYWKRRARPDETLKLVLAQIRSGDLARAQVTCASTPHPLGPAALAMLRLREAGPAEQEERLLIELSESKLTLERNLGMLGTMAAVAPLIGLLGTVYGIMQAFHDMGASGSSAPSVVAAGVAEALLTTGLGLVVAVPALLIFNHFTRRMAVMLTLAENGARTVRAALASAASKRESRPERLDETPYRVAVEDTLQPVEIG
jgi:biopolymer transport protein ExbB/TolQ